MEEVGGLWRLVLDKGLGLGALVVDEMQEVVAC